MSAWAFANIILYHVGDGNCLSSEEDASISPDEGAESEFGEGDSSYDEDSAELSSSDGSPPAKRS